MTYTVKASIERDEQIIDCSTPEVLGDEYGRYYASRSEAQDSADALQCTLSDYPELNKDTIYCVISSDRPFATGQRVCGGEGADYDEGVIVRYVSVDSVVVTWDSGVTARCPVSELRAL